MALLKNVLSQAQQQIKNDARGGVEAIKTGVKNQVQAQVNNVRNAARGAVDNAVRAGVSGVLGAAGSVLSGDLSGAGRQLMNIPGNMAGAAGNAVSGALRSLGITSGSTLSGGVEYLSVSSGPGGIPYGDALAGIMTRADPLHAYNWFCDLPQVNANGYAASLPWYYVEEATIPFRQFETRQVYREGRYKHYPGKYNVDSLRLAIYLDSDNTSLNYWQTWQNAILQPFNKATATSLGGGYRPPSQFKKDISFFLLDVRRQQIVNILYTECWPQQIDAFNLQSATSERLIGQVTLSVGDVFVNLLNMGNTNMTGIFSKLTRVPDAPTGGFSISTPPFVPQSVGTQAFPINTPSNSTARPL